MRSLVRCQLLLLVGAALVNTRVDAQFIDRIDVTIANVDVVVTDRRGQPVTGLTIEDFELYENGRQQTITNFSAPEAHAAAAKVPENRNTAGVVSAPLQTTNDRPRLIIFYYDVNDEDRSAHERFFTGVREFFESSLRDGDLVGVLTWNHRLRVLLTPTAARKPLYDVIHSLARRPEWSEEAFLRRTAEERVREAQLDSEFAAALPYGDSIDPQIEAAFQEFIQGERRCANLKRKVKELTSATRSIGRVEMQKIVIYATDDASMQPTRGCLLNAAYESLANTANSYGVTIHGMHPPGARENTIGPERGRMTPGTTDPAPMSRGFERAHDEAGGLVVLARKTGGIVAVGPEQAVTALSKAAMYLDSYYSLGYRVGPGPEDRPRTIKVTTKNRAYRVHARDSIVRPSDEQRLDEAVTTNLYLPPKAPSSAPAFQVSISGTRREGRYRMLDLQLAIRSADLLIQEEGKRSFTVLVAAGRELGDASDVTTRTQEFAAHGNSGEEAVTYSVTVRVRPDTTRLSVAVRDNGSGDVAMKLIAVPLR